MGTVRPLSIADAEALRRVPRVNAVVPAVWGNAEVKAGGKSRRTTVYGMGPAMPEAFSMKVQLGRFLPVKKIRVGGERYRVIGVMESKGQVLGMDLDDTVFIPAARTLDLFNRQPPRPRRLHHHDPATNDGRAGQRAQRADLRRRRPGQQERTSEIGLLRALGAERGQILLLFLGEAAVLAAIGGIAGLVLGVGGAQLLTLAVPALPVHTPWSYVLAAEVVAILIGFAAGVLPARRAAAMDPVEALRTE